MKKQKLNTISISPEVHKQIVVYCKKNGHKIYFWVTDVLIKAINEELEPPNK